MTIPLWLQHAIDTYGYLAILVAVALETMGVPFPGETALLVGAIYAGTGRSLNIALVIAAAAIGAIFGDNVGFSVGRLGGYPLLLRLAHLLRIDESKLLFAQRYFERHGDKTVLIGRFFSLLRTWVAFLAGANRMPRRSFFIWNAAGGILWALVYGLLGYILGKNLPLLGTVLHILGIGGIVLIVVFFGGLLGMWLARRRRERALLAAQADSLKNDPAAENAATRVLSGTAQRSGSLLVEMTEREREARERTAVERLADAPPDTRAKPRPQSRPQPKPRVRSRPQPRPQARPQPRPQARPQPRPQPPRPAVAKPRSGR